MRSVLLLSVLVAFGYWTPSIARAEEDVESARRAFLDQQSSVNPDRRARAAIDLGADDPWKLELLYRVLTDDHWYVRYAGARAMAKSTSATTRARLRADLLAHEEAKVRECIAVALGIRPEEGDAGALVGALADKSWPVRRGAARSLGEIVSREGIVALIERLDPEEHARVRVWAAWSLRLITGQGYLDDDRDAWRAWWKDHADDPGWGPLKGDVEVKRRELAGIKLETVTVAHDPKRSAKKPDLFVLPPYGYRAEFLRPHLDALAKRMRVTYIQLPDLAELTGQSGYDGEGIPTYPVARLVKAFDALRRELGKKRVSILAHGASSWMALRYAQKHPKQLDALVLVDGWLDAPGYVTALRRTLAKGRNAERWMARVLTNQDTRPKDRAVYREISRIGLTGNFRDTGDLEAAYAWTSWSPQGFSVVPDVKVTRRTKIEAPMLFLFPYENPMSGHADAVRIREVFPNAIAAVMRRSRGLPYQEERAEFYRIFDAFLARSGIAVDGTK